MSTLKENSVEPLLISEAIHKYLAKRPGLKFQLEMASAFPEEDDSYVTIDEMLFDLGRADDVSDEQYKLLHHLMYCSHLLQFQAEPPLKEVMVNGFVGSYCVFPKDSTGVLGMAVRLMVNNELSTLAKDIN